MDYEVIAGAFNNMSSVKWEYVDAQEKIEDKLGTSEMRDDTKVLKGPYTGFFAENLAKMEAESLHVYFSKEEEAETGGPTTELSDRLTVQCLGNTQYHFESGDVIQLTPGDSIYIKEGALCQVVHTGPRISCSFKYKRVVV